MNRKDYTKPYQEIVRIIEDLDNSYFFVFAGYIPNAHTESDYDDAVAVNLCYPI